MPLQLSAYSNIMPHTRFGMGVRRLQPPETLLSLKPGESFVMRHKPPKAGVGVVISNDKPNTHPDGDATRYNSLKGGEQDAFLLQLIDRLDRVN